ncbi:hypothetical protein [Serratia sp. M24T3]|uniref:hypothetical protein n=1 Tax=Serratia sp. M24T3 TaxID=932213 RepID=UPI00025BA58A|nr:hypothetical protein [Serratia sp. M24T3]EIC82154.1 hypothetical protein SPM24T3_23262 [Serratia sp. M24T3]
MNEQQVSQLLEAMAAQTKAMNRLAESNEALVSIIVQTLNEEEDTDLTSSAALEVNYLSGKPRG